MNKILKCSCEDQVRIVQIDDLIDFLNRTYEDKYFYQKTVEIDYPTKTKILSVFSKFENISSIEFPNNSEEEKNDYVIHFANGNKKTILATEYKDCNLILCKPLMENKDLIIVDTIKLLPIELDNFFRTTIKRNL